MPSTIIIGAGISGLTCAYELSKRGEDVLVIDASESAGGVMQSEGMDGYLVENGPNSLRGNLAQMSELLDGLQITSRMLQSSPEANRRYILRDGKAIVLPLGLLDIFSSKVISQSAKVRALREPFVARSTKLDESVAEFFERRFGKEIVEYLVGPFVSGIYAGDPNTLSIKATFPKLWRYEQSKGSVIRGAMSKKTPQKIAKDSQPASGESATKKPKKRAGLFSFVDGLAELPRAIASSLGEKLNLGTPVENISKDGATFIVEVAGSAVRAKKLILATPAFVSGKLLTAIAPQAATELIRMAYAPIIALHLGFDHAQFTTVPIGFGLLVPRSEARHFLGVIFSSSLFAGRAPKGKTLLTVLIGGATQPELTQLDESSLLNIVLPELRALYQISGEPEFVHLARWQRAIPQYNLGYDSIVGATTSIEQEHTGLHLLGSYRGGISVNDCIKNATELATTLV